MGPDSRDPHGVGDLFAMPGGASAYSDPEFSWLQTIAPTAILFPAGSALGAAYEDVALVGDANLVEHGPAHPVQHRADDVVDQRARAYVHQHDVDEHQHAARTGMSVCAEGVPTPDNRGVRSRPGHRRLGFGEGPARVALGPRCGDGSR